MAVEITNHVPLMGLIRDRACLLVAPKRTPRLIPLRPSNIDNGRRILDAPCGNHLRPCQSLPPKISSISFIPSRLFWPRFADNLPSLRTIVLNGRQPNSARRGK